MGFVAATTSVVYYHNIETSNFPKLLLGEPPHRYTDIQLYFDITLCNCVFLPPLLHSAFHLLGAGVHYKVHQAVEVRREQSGTTAPEVLYHSSVGHPVWTSDGRGGQRHPGQGEQPCFLLISQTE